MDTPLQGLGRRKLVAIVIALAVCAAVGLGVYLMTRDDLVIEQYGGAPPGVAGGDDSTDLLPNEPTAVVLMDEGTIHVTTMGSSSCPAVPIDVSVVDGVVVVTVDIESDGPCTADYGPTTSVIAVPDELKGSDEAPMVTIENT